MTQPTSAAQKVGFLADSGQRLIYASIKESPHLPMLDDEAAVVAQTNAQLAHGCIEIADALIAALEAK